MHAIDTEREMLKIKMTLERLRQICLILPPPLAVRTLHLKELLLLVRNDKGKVLLRTTIIHYYDNNKKY